MGHTFDLKGILNRINIPNAPKGGRYAAVAQNYITALASGHRP